METFRQVFVAIDFSPASDEALRRAHERAVTTGAKLAVTARAQPDRTAARHPSR